MGDGKERYDGAQILGEVSGLGKAEVMKIWEQVKCNHSRLAGCSRPHEFEPIQPSKATRPGEVRYRCRRCLGEISAGDYKWYLRGVEDGKVTYARG